LSGATAFAVTVTRSILLRMGMPTGKPLAKSKRKKGRATASFLQPGGVRRARLDRSLALPFCKSLGGPKGETPVEPRGKGFAEYGRDGEKPFEPPWHGGVIVADSP